MMSSDGHQLQTYAHPLNQQLRQHHISAAPYTISNDPFASTCNMPYDTNHLFGVLADPDVMQNRKCRGRSKHFEKDIAGISGPEEVDASTVAIAEDLEKTIDAELEKLRLLEDGPVTEEADKANIITDNKTDQAGKTNDQPSLFATPPPNRHRRQHQDKQFNDASPCPTHSGKPAHRHYRDRQTTTTSTSTRDDSRPLTVSPYHTLNAQQPPELFVFTNKRHYSHARALFATTSQPDHPSSLRWHNLASLLTSPPLSCHVIPARNGGSSVTVIRPARTRIVRGEEVLVPKRSVVLHRPHGGASAWVERHVLENMAVSLMARFGWRRGGFVLEGEEGATFQNQGLMVSV